MNVRLQGYMVVVDGKLFYCLQHIGHVQYADNLVVFHNGKTPDIGALHKPESVLDPESWIDAYDRFAHDVEHRSIPGVAMHIFARIDYFFEDILLGDDTVTVIFVSGLYNEAALPGTLHDLQCLGNRTAALDRLKILLHQG